VVQLDSLINKEALQLERIDSPYKSTNTLDSIAIEKFTLEKNHKLSSMKLP